MLHLAVRDLRSGRVMATCRVLSPAAAMRAGGYALERHFDASALAPLRERLVEVGAVWIDPAARAAVVFPELGDCITRYLLAEGYDFVVASAAVGIADGGHTAASMHREASERAPSPDDLRVVPLRELPLQRLQDTLPVKATPLLRGWLDLGAWVCGEPGWNREPQCAEIPLLLPLARMRSRHARRFVAQAA